jgi:hypothetical protein
MRLARRLSEASDKTRPIVPTALLRRIVDHRLHVCLPTFMPKEPFMPLTPELDWPDATITTRHIDEARATVRSVKPVGHVMVGLPDRRSLQAMKDALAETDQPGLAADELTPNESIDEIQAMIDKASPLAGFGYELTLMRRYVQLARQGYNWLVVKVDSDQQADRVAQLARRFQASLAVRYGHLTVEDLI